MGAEHRAARWVSVLLVLVVLLQRVATPGVPDLSFLVPVVLLWTGFAAAAGVVRFDRSRLTWWMAAASITAMAMLAQNALVAEAEISITAWGLFMAVWLPFTVRLRTAGTSGYRLFLTSATNVLTSLAVVTVAMVGSQLAGLPYRDWFASLVPQSLQLGGFVITYPISYGSPIYRGNAWIGLEPSMISAQLGLGVLAAILSGARIWKMVVLLVGLIATVSGSGIAIVVVGLVVVLLSSGRRMLARYSLLGLITVAATTLTPFGQLLLDRSTELQSSGSSASLRALEPYAVLWPAWVENFTGVLLGYGPGSSQRLVANTNVLGLLVPSPAKVFFEYGIIPGLVLAAFLAISYIGGPSRAFSLSLFISLWFFQPGTTTMVIVAPVLLFVTLWSPRVGPPLESQRQLDPTGLGLPNADPDPAVSAVVRSA